MLALRIINFRRSREKSREKRDGRWEMRENAKCFDAKNRKPERGPKSKAADVIGGKIARVIRCFFG
jgi:hypothetical protein